MSKGDNNLDPIPYNYNIEGSTNRMVKSNKKFKIPFTILIFLFLITWVTYCTKNNQSIKSKLLVKEQKEDSLRMAKYKEQVHKVSLYTDSINKIVSLNKLNDPKDPPKVIDTLREKFINGENQEKYSAASDHTFNLDFNAPKVDKKRGLDPKNVVDGIQRAYFENSDNICIQRTLIKGQVIEEIQYHPDGRIYSITNLVNGKKDGKIKCVDLDNVIILEGEFYQGKLIGTWNSPTLANFDPNSKMLEEQYPGVINQIFTLIHFYEYTKDERNFYMN